MATIRPIHRLSVRLAATTAVCAAISIMPSMPMLTTPARSLITPHKRGQCDGRGAHQRAAQHADQVERLPARRPGQEGDDEEHGDEPDDQAGTLEAARDLHRAQEDGHGGQEIDRGCGRNGQVGDAKCLRADARIHAELRGQPALQPEAEEQEDGKADQQEHDAGDPAAPDLGRERPGCSCSSHGRLLPVSLKIPTRGSARPSPRPASAGDRASG